MTPYEEFLGTKKLIATPSGFEVGESAVSDSLFPFQRDIVRWAIRKGKAAIFADTGLGKTRMQLEWAKHVAEETGGNVLIFAPLAVAPQTKREGEKIGVRVHVAHGMGDIVPGINITNYAKIHDKDGAFRFDSDKFAGVVLDESSILKSYEGAFRKSITQFSAHIPYRLACTATPAPNDQTEIINHAEYMGVMTGKEILATFFIQDGNTTHNWRLKGHAVKDYYRWLASWAVALRNPSDLGYSDDGFILPPLNVHEITIGQGLSSDGALFDMPAQTLSEQRKVKRDSMPERVRVVADMVNGSSDQWIVWCHLNDESDALTAAIPGAVEVQGKHDDEHKERAMLGFADGSVRVLVTKPQIAGFGMNWQGCHKVIFAGLSHSYEQYYQAVRRCWRFGQTKPVDCYVISAEGEGAIVENLKRKDHDAAAMMTGLVREMSVYTDEDLHATKRSEMEYNIEHTDGNGWRLYLGDCVERIDQIPDESVGLSVFSPPFPGMYAYTDSSRDMGNVKDGDEMLKHFRYLVGKNKLYRILKPGRSVCIHLTQTPIFKHQAGYVGLKDFRGDVIRLMESEGWIYYGEVTIDKDPQLKAMRTKDATLQFKSLSTDSNRMRPAMADYILIFKKHGDNAEPIKAGMMNAGGWITNDEWIEWAAPVWYRASGDYPGGIRESDVLNVREARDDDDEKHLCPLQLGVIERLVKLYSNPGDTVFTPFGGIGSELYESVRLGRKAIGIELKRAYYETAIRNLKRLEAEKSQGILFADEEVA